MDKKHFLDETESFLCDLLRRLVYKLYKDGQEAQIEGVKLLNDGNDFILGSLIHATYRLFAKSKEAEKHELSLALTTFFSWATTAPAGTWGKLSILAVLVDLKKTGALSILDKKTLSALKERTAIDDFYDRRTHTLIGKAANYYHVAATCAAFRASLGWETDEMAKAVTERLLLAVTEGGADGFLDDQPPEGRFDSYTFMVARELADQCAEVGIPIPEHAKKNLLRAAKATLHMANSRGDGFVYGRSLGIYGDSSPIRLLLSASKHDLLTEAEKETAAAYLCAILEKMRRFWFDEKRGIFNIWFDGRGTDGYREVHRLLEVNLGVAETLLTATEELKALGLTKVSAEALPHPSKWRAYPVSFLDTPERKATAIILRRKDCLAMLPLIGSGSLAFFSNYLPFPGIAGILEAAPQSYAPYLVPEYIYQGEVYRPIQFYTDITLEETEDGVTVKAMGNLALPRYYPERAKPTAYTFEAEYRFEGEKISARFKTDLKDAKARMQTALGAKTPHFTLFGFDKSEPLSLEKKDACAPHGAYSAAYMHSSLNPCELGWEITLSRKGIEPVRFWRKNNGVCFR